MRRTSNDELPANHSRKRVGPAALGIGLLAAGMATILTVGFPGGRGATSVLAAAGTSAPTFSSADSVNETTGVAFDFAVQASGTPIPKLTKSGALPGVVNFKNNGDGTADIAGTPGKNAGGSYAITITAKNSAGTATQTFTLTVQAAPAVKKIPTPVTRFGDAITVPITATGYPAPAISVDFLPDGVILTDHGDGTADLSGTPRPGSGGAYGVTVTATNAAAASSTSFTFKVKEAPTFRSEETGLAPVGYAYVFQAAAAGFPAPKITETGALPKGLKYRAADDTISGTPAAGTEGSYPITFTASNSEGSTTQQFVLTVDDSTPPTPEPTRTPMPPGPTSTGFPTSSSPPSGV
ncbi:MAG: hypothetical protein JWN96_228 [Mycobacterium sp.]|nr:hypothetical protein [Mycobacterium sp.]